jgi:hypothetical protein
MHKCLTATFGALCILFAGSAHADEGMWTFDNFPAAAVKQKYGVSIDKSWLDHIRAASVRLSNGCSASLVTAQGLVLTNHHCVRDCAQNLSTAATNYVRDGFSAARREDERLCAGMQAEILEDISDVTSAINAGSAGKTGGDFVKARDAAIALAEKQGCAGKEALYRCQVITLYQGGQYKLYRYRKYSDVRLVFAPEAQTAFFGGDPDNFNFPRYDLDFSFVRLYEKGKSVASPNHLTWSAAAPGDGTPIFVSGNPGSTQRLLTAEQLAFLRDFQLPETLILYSELRGRLLRFASESAEHERISEDFLFGIENSFKAYHGEEQALVDPALIAAKTKYDNDLKAAVKKDAGLTASIGDPWSQIAAVQATRKALYRPYYFMEARAGIGSDLFRYARALVRAAAERPKPNGERLPEYTDSKLPLLEKTVLDPAPVYPELEQLALEFWLSKLRENLTADAAGTKTFLGKDSPETLAARLAKSRLADPALRKKLWEGGRAAVEASDDPMIVFVRNTDAASRAVRKQYEDQVTGPTDRASEKIARARFAVHGTRDYPDATFSLRLSYGAVKGWTYNGQTIPPFTYFSGLWQRATGQYPFNLAPKWQNAQNKLNPGTVFDFVTDNDIIGGNSGSPAITAKGEVVGAAFDGNIESLGGAFGFDGRVNRTVVASTAAITEALQKLYGQQALVQELTRP